MSAKLARFSIYEAWQDGGSQHVKLDIGNRSGLPEDVVVEFKSREDLLQQADRHWEHIKKVCANRRIGMSVRVRTGTRQPNGFNQTRWGSMQFHEPQQEA